MSLFSSLVKAGIAKKVFDEARKPANQAKAKEMYAQYKSKKTKPAPSIYPEKTYPTKPTI